MEHDIAINNIKVGSIVKFKNDLYSYRINLYDKGILHGSFRTEEQAKSRLLENLNNVYSILKEVFR